MTDSTVFIITVGGSGSSQFAKMIEELGIPIHDKYSKAGKDYYENRTMTVENRRLMGFDDRVIDLNRISGTPRGDFTGVLKDTRTVCTFHLWLAQYPSAKYIFLARNSDDIRSGSYMSGQDPRFFAQRMQCFYRAMDICREFLYVHYDMLSYDFERTMRRVAEYCSVPYKPLSGWRPKYYGQMVVGR